MCADENAPWSRMAGEGIELHIGLLEAIDTGEALEACRATFSLERNDIAQIVLCGKRHRREPGRFAPATGGFPAAGKGEACCRACGAVLAFPLAAVTTNKEKHHAGQRPDQNGFP